MLKLGASLERASEHPLAAAIVGGAEGRKLELQPATDFASETGGVRGTVNGKAVAIGNRKLLESLGIDLGLLDAKAAALRSEGQTVMFVAIDKRPAGLIGVADPIKDSTPEAIAALHEEGLQIVMLTGDKKGHRRGGRPQAQDRSRRRGGPARAEDRGHQAAAGRRSRRGHGGRRHQRRAGAGAGAGRHRHGHRHRRRHGKRRGDLGQG